MFSTLLSVLFSFFLPLATSDALYDTTCDLLRGGVSQALVCLSRNCTASCLSSWEAVLRAFSTIFVKMLQKRPVPSRHRFYKEMLFFCFVAIVTVCAVQNATTSTVFVNKIATG